MKLGIGKSELGWEVTYDGIFGPESESTVYKTKSEARAACEQQAAEIRAWNNRSLADAPHMDNY
jgi:hypothetical protein